MPEIDFDRLSYVPELGALRKATIAHDWDALVAYFSEWREADPQRLTPAAWTVAESEGVELFLEPRTHLPLSRALRAHLRVKEAWDIRTRSRAENVSAEQWRGFRAKLVEAEQELVALAAADPRDPIVAALRLTTARGLELGLSEAQRRYDRLAAITPDHLPGQSAHLQTLTPKWFGSWELAFAFAHACVERGRPGSGAGRLVAEAQLERWLDLPAGEDVAYLERPESRAELIAAADASVFHPHYEPGILGVTDHSVFALVHSLAGRPSDAARHFGALGDAADLEPWKYLNDPKAAFLGHRSAALKAGGWG